MAQTDRHVCRSRPTCTMLPALRFLQDETVPWQRVLSASGKISPRGDAGEGALRQQVALEGEGVEVVNDEGLGRVSLAQYGWFPEAVAEG